MIHALVGRPASPAVGYQMINSVTIENFRGFDVAKLDGCRRINVIVGENGSGKTALLEGIFLAAGPAEIALRLRGWRGIESGQGSATHEQLVHALWGDLFHNFQMDKPARIALTGSEGHTRAITIRHREHA